VHIPKKFITIETAIERLMEVRHPELIAREKELEGEKRWLTAAFDVSLAPRPIIQLAAAFL